MTDQDNWMWLVGLLEGEGCFVAPSPSLPNIPRVVMNMTDRDVVARAAALMGIRYISARDVAKYSKGRPWKMCYGITLSGTRAIRLMTRMRPFLCERRQGAIDKVFASYSPRRADGPRKLAVPFELVPLCEHPLCTTPASQKCAAHPKPRQRLKLVG